MELQGYNLQFYISTGGKFLTSYSVARITQTHRKIGLNSFNKESQDHLHFFYFEGKTTSTLHPFVNLTLLNSIIPKHNFNFCLFFANFNILLAMIHCPVIDQGIYIKILKPQNKHEYLHQPTPQSTVNVNGIIDGLASACIRCSCLPDRSCVVGFYSIISIKMLLVPW